MRKKVTRKIFPSSNWDKKDRDKLKENGIDNNKNDNNNNKNYKSVFQFEIRLQVHRDMLKEVPYPAKGSS